jgi:hypothetical protein
MDQNSPVQWVDLGAALLKVHDGGAWAERAFRRGLELDAAVAEKIEAARTAARAAEQHQIEQERTIEQQKLRTSSPEAVAWPADPWPELDADGRVDAIAELKADAARILRQAGIRLTPLETDHYLIYADLPPMGTARLATRLEDTYKTLAELLWLEEQGNRFWGKAVVFYFADADRFRLVEAESFDQLVARRVTAICHYDGPKVFISLTGDPDTDEFYPAAVGAAVHGFLHRYRSPRRLPPWANEGLPAYIATKVSRNDLTDARRVRGLDFIRAAHDVSALLLATYDDAWPGPDDAGPAVGALLVELMLLQRQGPFGAWIRGVKSGDDWQPALTADYGVSFPTLLTTFTQFYRVNN